MLSSRWRKAIRDLWLNRTRTFLVVLSIAVGIFGVGAVACSYSILMRELRDNYLATNPASATLWTDPFDDDFVEAVRDIPAVGEAEGRCTVTGRIQVGPGEWRLVQLFVINDFDDVRINIIEPEQGAWPPADRDILIERDALTVARADIGDTVFVKTPNGTRRALRVAGSVYDLGQDPAGLGGTVYGYITLDTLEWLGEPRSLNELSIVVAENPSDKEHITGVAAQVEDWIERSGRTVYRTEIPTPGEHPFNDSLASLLFLQAAFGLLALFLSGFLVVNMISALLAQQIRQIGMMKAVGARARQIMGVYFGVVLMLGLLALVIAMPAGVWAGRAYSVFVADTLNFNVESDEIPRSVFALQAAVGLLAPILAAAYPVYKGTRVTVHQALNDYGVGQNKFGTSDIDLLLGQIRGLTRPFLLSLRNTFRRRGRLILTLGTLAVGGAVFIAATSVRASLLNTIDDAFNFRLYDVDVRFSRPYRTERIEQHARDIPGVVKIESWSGSAAAVRVYPDDTEGDPFNVIAPPATTEFIQPAVVEGRWLLPGDENGLVVNNELLDGEPDIDVGDEIVLKIGGRETTWQVIGIVREVMASPGAYANYAYFAQATRQVGYANSVRVATRGHDETSYAVMQSLEQSFEDAGLDVLVTLRTSDVRKYIQDHFSIMTTLLLLMSILIAIVGGLGLASTMSINVIERTREIGVMRAIGASTRSVLQIIVVEGVLIGVLSWCVAAVLALPLSIIISNALGMMLLQTTLSFVFSLPGLATWFVIVVIFTAAASFSPAWSASRLTVRQVLAYE